MSLLDAIWLGIVQGLTEFLPVSSDGHLALAHIVLGAQGNEDLFFDLVLHLGTLIAVFAVFGRDVLRFTGEALAGLKQVPSLGLKGALAGSEGLRLMLLVVIASVPTAIIGLMLKKSVESHAFSLAAIAGMIMLNGVTLYSSKFAPPAKVTDNPLAVAGITPVAALLIGIAQGLAVLPGISRSGSTIVSSLWLGAERERAAQFSFLLAIPAILGAFALQLDPESVGIALDNPVPYLVGALLSAVVGVVALRLLLRLLKAARFYHFAWYCWLLGAVALVASFYTSGH